MGQRFVACDREQSFLMPPDVREWLPPRHLAWSVIDAIAEMELNAFYAAYRVDGRSRAPYDPAMMVGLLLYAYARGIRSSRVIARLRRGRGSETTRPLLGGWVASATVGAVVELDEAAIDAPGDELVGKCRSAVSATGREGEPSAVLQRHVPALDRRCRARLSAWCRSARAS
jgi:hypothetical protein